MTGRFGAIPVVSIVGRGDSGKTTFVVKLITELTERGYAVATVKHFQHEFETDVVGKDSWRHAQAGSIAAMVSSPTKLSIVRKVDRERTIAELVEEATRAGADILVTEGFKLEGADKFELSRKARGLDPALGIEDVVGLITDDDELAEGYRAAGRPIYGLDDINRFADDIAAKYLGGEDRDGGR